MTTLGLFPLQAVLVPGARLGLRIFEARYLDLVRECGRTGEGFGICLVLPGKEPDAPAASAAFGTEACIEDFGTSREGLLTLQVRGARRFHVRRTRVRDNGLLVGEVEWCVEAAASRIRPEHALLSTLLRGILEQAGTAPLGIVEERFDDADWVGWRLAEVLPMSDTQRQALLQEDDAHGRLAQLVALVS